MELSEVLLKRRSVRKYKDTPVEEEKINALLHAGMSGPSALNKKPWYFCVVENKKIIEELRLAGPNSNRVAPLTIVLCANINECIEGKRGEYWIQDLSAATENILLKATELGLGSLWCGIHLQDEPQAKVKKILDLPENIVPFNIIYVGYSDEDLIPRDQFDINKVKRY